MHSRRVSDPLAPRCIARLQVDPVWCAAPDASGDRVLAAVSHSPAPPAHHTLSRRRPFSLRHRVLPERRVCVRVCPDPPLVLSSPTGHVVFAPHPFALALPRVLGARPRAQLVEERRQDRCRQDRGAPRRRSTPARAPPDKCRRSTCICWTGRRVNYNIANFAFGNDDM